MGQWMTAPEAFAFLILAAGLLAALLPCAVWPRPLPRLSAGLAIAGLALAALALRILKSKTGAAGGAESADFRCARNAESLALAAIPLALALLRHEKIARAGALALGLPGAWMLGAWLMPGGEAWGASMAERDVFAASAIPGLARLAAPGTLQEARWLGFAGALLAALPLAQLLLRRTRERALSGEDEGGLICVLLGLGLLSLAMGAFFWHPGDWAHRLYALHFMQLAALNALVLALAHGRIVSATWVRLGLSGLSAILALWLGSGVLGGDFAAGSQRLGDFLPSFLLLVLLALALPVLLLHGAGAAALGGARWMAGRFRRRSAAARS